MPKNVRLGFERTTQQCVVGWKRGERGWRVRKASSSPNAAKGGGRERERERETVFDPLNHLSPLRKKSRFFGVGGFLRRWLRGTKAEVEQDGDPVPIPEEHKCSFPKGQFRNDSSLFYDTKLSTRTL